MTTGKLRVFKKVISHPESLTFLQSLGKGRDLTKENIEQIKDLYAVPFTVEKKNETYVETRIRLYKNLRKKSSMPLPPDPDPVVQVIKRAHFQAYEWYHCNESIISHLHLENWGWRVQDEQVIPVWFTGNQIPPSMRNSRQRKKLKNSDDEDECIADDESSSLEDQPPKKKPRKAAKTEKTSRRRILEATALSDKDEDGDIDTDFVSELCSQERQYSSMESEWEVSDFLSSDTSFGEWLP